MFEQTQAGDNGSSSILTPQPTQYANNPNTQVAGMPNGQSPESPQQRPGPQPVMRMQQSSVAPDTHNENPLAAYAVAVQHSQQQPTPNAHPQQPGQQFTPQQATTQMQPAPQQQQPQPDPNNTAADLTLPTAEELGKVAAAQLQNLQLNPEKLQAAFGENVDANAMTAFMQDVLQQVMASTLNVSGLLSKELATRVGTQSTTEAQTQMQKTQDNQTALAAAHALDPSLGTDQYKINMLQTTIDTLRQQYPGAPSDIIGQEAAKIVNPAITQPQSSQEDSTDWMSHLQS